MEAAERSRKQVEYAAKTVASAPPCIALRCKDGVFLAAFTPKALMRLPSRWIKRKRHLFRVTDSISVGLTGIYSDCVRLLEFMRSVASEHKLKLQEEIPSRMLCDAVSERLFEFNNDESMRTLAVSCIIASTPKRLDNITGVTDDDALDYPEIFLVHMDGTYDGSFLATATHAQHSCMDVLKLLRARDWREMTVGEADAEVRSFCASNRSTGPREKILLETWNMPI
jgi:20S proteasome alpha/beta subunit